MNFSFDEDMPLDKEELARRFREAQTHFREGRKTAALQILCELDKACPNQPDYMYAIGVTRSELGHNRDAEDIALRLRDQLKDPRGEQLLARIEQIRKARAESIKTSAPAPAAPETEPADSGGLISRLQRRADRAKTSDAGVGGFADKLTGCTVAAIGLVICSTAALILLGRVGAAAVALVYLLIAGRLMRSRH